MIKRITQLLRMFWFISKKSIGMVEKIDIETGETIEQYNAVKETIVITCCISLIGFLVIGSSFSIVKIGTITFLFLIIGHLDKSIEAYKKYKLYE